MTEATIYKTDDNINKIIVQGHAFYADYGQDIVCSAISMICYTIANKLLSIEEENIDVVIEEGKFQISLKDFTNDNQLLISTLKMGLMMIEEQYNNNIKVKEV